MTRAELLDRARRGARAVSAAIAEAAHRCTIRVDLGVVQLEIDPPRRRRRRPKEGDKPHAPSR